MCSTVRTSGPPRAQDLRRTPIWTLDRVGSRCRSIEPLHLVPRRRDFDRMKRRQLFAWNEHGDGSGLAGLALNEPALMQRHDHAVDGRRRDAKKLLKVAFRGRPPAERRVRVDEGEVLPLGGGDRDRHVVPSVIRCSAVGLRYRVELDFASRISRNNGVHESVAVAHLFDLRLRRYLTQF